MLDGDGRPEDDSRSWQRFLSDKDFGLPTVTPENRAVLFYTSGTSEKPKSVPLSHHNIVSNLSALLELDLIRKTDRVLLPLPLHHVYPFTVGMLAPLASGAALRERVEALHHDSTAPFEA